MTTAESPRCASGDPGRCAAPAAFPVTSQSRTGRCCSARSRDGVVEARGLGRGGDNLSTAAALRALGVDVADRRRRGAHSRASASRGSRAAVGAARLRQLGDDHPPADGPARRAGRSRRELCGDASLTRRPMRRVAEPLRRMGATIEGRSRRRPDPATCSRRCACAAARSPASRYELPVPSAQLKSALVLAALQATGAHELREPGALARSHRADAARRWARPSPSTPGPARSSSIRPAGTAAAARADRHPGRSVVGDVPRSSPPLTVAGSEVSRRERRPEPDPRRRPRRAGARWARDIDDRRRRRDAMGEPVGRVRRPRVRACAARAIAGELALRAIDEIPALAVAAALRRGRHRVRRSRRAARQGVGPHRRHRARARARRRRGRGTARTDSWSSGLGGRPPAGGAVQPEHDHRIAMAGAVLGLVGGRRDHRPGGRHRDVVPDVRRDAGRAGRASI